MKCLLVVNTLCGNASKVNEDALLRLYAPEDDVTVRYIRSAEDSYSLDGVDKLILCGGDGTLHHALALAKDKAIDLYYLPVGTFNETAKDVKPQGELARLGKIGETDFAYVAAAGSFTDLGQSSSAKQKKRFKIFAYFFHILKSYRVHRIRATISYGDFSETEDYTLIMLSNAARCFGFRFNRLHRHNDDELQLLTIKAPKKDNLLGRIKMFFPFFRAFFIGFSEPHFGKSVRFLSLKEVSLSLPEKTDFCLDGERRVLFGDLTARTVTHATRVRILSPRHPF